MLQKQVLIVILFTIISACTATVPSFRATKATETLPLIFGTPIVPFDAAGDIMLVPLHPLTEHENGSISIRRRGPDGMYNEVSQFYEQAYPFTNGEWIAVIVYSDPDKQWIMKFYKLDGDTPTNVVSFPVIQPRTVRFFPGNVFVTESYESSPRTLEIYSYTDGSWSHNNSVQLSNNHTVMTVFYRLSTDGKFVVTYNDSFVDIWEFQSNPPTFNRIESFPYDSNYKTLGLYNGVDTVVTASYAVVDNDVSGGFLVYTKSNGEWSMTQNVTAYQLGLRGTAFLGITGLFIDENTFMLNAFLENSVIPMTSPGGKSVVMSRGVDGMWSQSMQIEADPNDVVTFGYNVFLNDYNELLIPGVNINDPNNATGYIYSTCLTSPINVTCNDISTPTDCTNLDTTSLYTINSSPACGEINATVVSSTTTDNQVKVELNFSKTGASTSCTSTVTCLAAPTTAPIATPVASSTPVKAPTGKVSHAAAVKFTGAMLLGITLAL